MAEDGGPPPKKAKVTKEELEQLSKEELLEKCIEQETYIKTLESKVGNADGNEELVGLRESEEKLRQQQAEATRRESILVMRLTSKEQETQDYVNQINELKQAQNPSAAQLRSMLLDPAINLMFQRMKKEMEMAKDKQEQAQNDLAAWKFTPDSQTGKRLMNKCRMLLQENEELGRVIASGRTAKLEGEIALEKKFIEEMKKSQAETDEFLVEMDEDVEGMQSTIYFLQQQLKDSKDQVELLQQENAALKQAAATSNPTNTNTDTTSPPQQYQLMKVKEEPLDEAEVKEGKLDGEVERTGVWGDEHTESLSRQEQVRTPSSMLEVTAAAEGAADPSRSSSSSSRSNSSEPGTETYEEDAGTPASQSTQSPTQPPPQPGDNGSRSHSPAERSSSLNSRTSPQTFGNPQHNGCTSDHVAMETDPVYDRQQQQEVESCDNGHQPKQTTASPTTGNHNNHRTSQSSSLEGGTLDGTDISSDAWSPLPSRQTPTTDTCKDPSQLEDDVEHSSRVKDTRTAGNKMAAAEALQNGLIADQALVKQEAMDF